MTGPAAGRLTETTDSPRCSGDAGVAAVLILALASVLTLVGADRPRWLLSLWLASGPRPRGWLSRPRAGCSTTPIGDVADVVAQVRHPVRSAGSGRRLPEPEPDRETRRPVHPLDPRPLTDDRLRGVTSRGGRSLQGCPVRP